jgi:hypothetical protein
MIAQTKVVAVSVCRGIKNSWIRMAGKGENVTRKGRSVSIFYLPKKNCCLAAELV